jgi:oligopeptidase A
MLNPLLDTSGLPNFDAIKPQHALPALQELISAHRQKLTDILAQSEVHDCSSLITPMEEMSHALSRVSSPIGHLQSVLDDVAWRDAYNQSLPLLTDHGTELSQNTELQKVYSQVKDSLPDSANPALHALIDQELRNFRLAGVALPDKQKIRYREIAQEVASLQATFEQNIQDSTDHWYHKTTDANAVDGLPDPVRQRALADAKSKGVEGWLFKLDYPNYHAVMTHGENRELRRIFYRAWSTRASDQEADAQWDNGEIIERIMSLRHEAAQIVGFENYAAYSLATKMASSIDEVTEFLTELADRSRQTAKMELQALNDLAEQPIEPWDLSFYMEKWKQDRFTISDEQLKQYFPFTTVKKGMFNIAERLYEISVVENTKASGWHEDVQYYEIKNSNNELIGSFYTDLFARNGKRGGAWMDECVVRKGIAGKYTRPVGYLICNFQPPDENGMSLLTHTDVITLFHEFGHILHHLLTRIGYPSISGINGVPWDAVELPSQFMENFAWCYDVLKECSSHHDSGASLPPEVFDNLEASRNFGEALAMLRQIELALFDFRIHANYDPGKGARALPTLEAVRAEVALIKHPDFNRLPHSFSHIFAGGYAAGYYSYKWAEVLAADAFSAFEENGIFDRATAIRFREEILEIGGSRDFMDAYVSFRGRKPTLDALLRQNGIGEAA